MSNAPRKTRSFCKIQKNDLRRLAALATEKLETVFQRRPDMRRLYKHRLIAICLCQGAANHFVFPRSKPGNGVNDFDLWAFFAIKQKTPFWNRRGSTADFGPSKFGRSSLDQKRYTGRRVDIFWRAIPAVKGTVQMAAITDWLSRGKVPSARELRKKAVVVIYPRNKAGRILWVAPTA